jgi:hypothetical protein
MGQGAKEPQRGRRIRASSRSLQGNRPRLTLSLRRLPVTALFASTLPATLGAKAATATIAVDKEDVQYVLLDLTPLDRRFANRGKLGSFDCFACT